MGSSRAVLLGLLPGILSVLLLLLNADIALGLKTPK